MEDDKQTKEISGEMEWVEIREVQWSNGKQNSLESETQGVFRRLESNMPVVVQMGMLCAYRLVPYQYFSLEVNLHTLGTEWIRNVSEAVGVCSHKKPTWFFYCQGP